jgi:hypothetical protein
MIHLTTVDRATTLINERSRVMDKKAVLQSVVGIILLAALALLAACVPAQSESVAEASTSSDVVSSAQQMLQEQIGRARALREVSVESAIVSDIVEEEMERALARGGSADEVLASGESVLSVQQLVEDKIELALAGDAPGAHSTDQPALDVHIERALAFRVAAVEDSASIVVASEAQPALDAHIERALAFRVAGAIASDSGATESPEQQMLHEQIERVRALQESEG